MNMFARLLILAALALVGLSPLTAMGQPEKSYTLTVLSTNDTHGHPMEFAWSDTVDGVAYNSPAAGGIPARKTYIDSVKAAQPNTLVLDAGDLTTGLVMSNLFKAQPDVLGMNLAGYQALTAGNHEFDNDRAALAARQADAKFPFLAANVYDKATGKRQFQPYLIVPFKDFKVAVIGLATPETPIVTLPENVAGLEFRDGADEVNALAREVRKQADFVIVLSHLGLADDRALAERVLGVDLIIGGHSHTYMAKAEVVNDVPIFQAYQWGLFVGRTDIVVEKNRLVSVNSVPVPINLAINYKDGDPVKGVVREVAGKKYDYVGGYLAPDAAVTSLLQPFADKVAKDLDTVIGTATAAFPDTIKGLSRYPRRDDSALSNMINDGLREETSRIVNQKVDVFMQSGGSIRATIPAGPISKKTIYTVLPFDNTIQTVSMTGAQLLDVLTNRALPVAIANYTTGWDGPSGAYLQVSGMTFTLDLTAKTIADVTVGGAPLDLAKVYLVASQNFMMTGGDGYAMLAALPGKYETSAFLRDAMISWMVRKGTLDPATYEDNRINMVNTGR
ncbi:MAG: 5'-nucleotidase C-terminal domain-containing protein [Spirochaetales bacterium]